MPKYLIDWNICGTTEIEAADADQATLLFDQITMREHVENGEFEVLSGPETKEERESEWERWRAAMDNISREKKKHAPGQHDL